MDRCEARGLRSSAFCVATPGAEAVMTPCPDMIRCDIHTHHPPADPTSPAVISVDATEPFSPLPGRHYAVGIHPWHADADLLPVLRRRAIHPQAVMIGEGGLDRLAGAPMETQIALFEVQIQLAEELHKPLIIHCVRAWGELLDVRKRLRPLQPWIVHGFRGKAPLASQLLRAGLNLSFGLLHRVDALKVAWEARSLFVETDDALLGIATVYERIAEELQVSVDTLARDVEGRFAAFIP